MVQSAETFRSIDLGFGERLLLIRHRKGMSGRKLAARAGISTASLSRYEHGIREPKIGELVALAEALEVSPHELLGYPGDRTTLEELSGARFSAERPPARPIALLRLAPLPLS